LVALIIASVGGLSPLAKWMVNWVPISWQIELGRAMGSDSSHALDDPFAQKYITTIGGYLLRQVPNNPFQFKFEVTDLPQVNAYAYVDGKIRVNAGLIQILDSPDELAAVLSHEIEHVLQRHIFQTYFREMIIALVYRKFFNAHYTADLIGLKYDRSQEAEADQMGMKFMRAAGFPGKAMVRIFVLMEKLDGNLPNAIEFLSSHPLSRHRMETLKREVTQSLRKVPAGLDRNWETFKRHCQTKRGKS
jgi:predicted Zn-dependent protease